MFHLNGKRNWRWAAQGALSLLVDLKLISSALQERRQKLTQPEVAEHKTCRLLVVETSSPFNGTQTAGERGPKVAETAQTAIWMRNVYEIRGSGK